jgi:uncharacterized phage protein gp47/JayE
MAFEIDGETWQPKSASEHADLMIDKINQLMQENNITDKQGNIIQLKKNYGNALYLLTLGSGQRFADNDTALSKAINSFNIELADDQQIENLLPIAAIVRNPGSYSTLKLTVTASEDGPCTIPAGTKAPFENMNFVTQVDAVIQAGHTQIIDTVADTIGPVVVLRGEVTAFDTDIANLESVENMVSSVPGNAAETTDALRQRILQGLTIPYSIDGVKLALEELTGINHARVFFNVYPDQTITLPGGIVLQPRNAYIVVNGQSDKIAETYAKYMSAETQNAPNASPTGTATTVNIEVTAVAGAAATVPSGTSFIYDGVTFTTNTDTTVAAGTTEVILFTAVRVGSVIIPAGRITGFEEAIANIDTVTNQASTPGIDRTAYSQDFVTSSGQVIPIKYDTSLNERVYVKITLDEGKSKDPQIENQLKRDLIAASAEWVIGENVTSLSTGAPFAKCQYTKVAYTQVSLDGSTWSNAVDTPANSIPTVSDDMIIVEEFPS